MDGNYQDLGDLPLLFFSSLCVSISMFLLFYRTLGVLFKVGLLNESCSQLFTKSVE